MDLTKDQWTLIGVGAGGLLAGALGASLFSGPKAAKTGLSRLYRMKGAKQSDVVIEIWASGDGYFLNGRAPYGIVSTQGEPDEEAEDQWNEDLGDAKDFGEPEDAAAAADDIMKELSYSPVDHWLDSLKNDLQEETA